MNLFLAVVTLASIAISHGQQGEKGNSIIPFPRVGRSDRFFMGDKRNGNSMSPGLIPFPRIGRSDGNAILEGKRQLIPFPRVGKRSYWHFPMDPYNMFEYEDYPYPMIDTATTNNLLASSPIESSSNPLEDNENDKRNQNNGGSMWFGPRLGKRRKRSISEADSAEHSRDSLDTKTLIKILHNFNWAIVPIKERRTFTPRLGRSSDEIGIHHRAQPFSPRLGRSREVASAEIEFEEDGQGQSQSRFSRSESSGHGKGTQQPPPDIVLTPRLGRDHFSPRLGRSGEDHE